MRDLIDPSLFFRSKLILRTKYLSAWTENGVDGDSLGYFLSLFLIGFIFESFDVLLYRIGLRLIEFRLLGSLHSQ